MNNSWEQRDTSWKCQGLSKEVWLRALAEKSCHDWATPCSRSLTNFIFSESWEVGIIISLLLLRLRVPRKPLKAVQRFICNWNCSRWCCYSVATAQGTIARTPQSCLLPSRVCERASQGHTGTPCQGKGDGWAHKGTGQIQKGLIHLQYQVTVILQKPSSKEPFSRNYYISKALL